MLKAGAGEAATGENPVLVACREADVILGPIGILSVNMCRTHVVGVAALTFTDLVAAAVEELKSVLRAVPPEGGALPARRE